MSNRAKSKGGVARASATDPSQGNKWLVAMTVALATIMEIIDDTSVAVALTSIAGGLSAGQDEATWVLTTQFVAKAVAIPASGYLATVIGRKRFFLFSIVLYTVTSLFCGLATSLPMLIIMRVIQGLGGGVLSPLAQAILADAFPPRERGQAFAVYGFAVIVGPIIGPTLGGWLVDNFSWRWVFFVNIPIGVLTFILLTFLIADPPRLVAERRRRRKVGLRSDFVGFGMIALGLSAIQIVLDRGQREEWFDSTYLLFFAVVGALALTAGVIAELYHEEPVVDLRLFRNRTFAAANFLNFAVFAVLLSTSVSIPQFAQSLLGYSATKAGLVLSPGGLAVALVTPLIGFLVSRVEARWMILFGLVWSAGALFYISQVLGTQIDFATLAWARIFQTIGLAFLFIPISTVGYVGISSSQINQASAILNLTRNLGGSVGVAVVTTLQARGAQFYQNRLIENLTPYNSQLRSALAGLTTAFGGDTAGGGDSSRRALGALYRVVQQQAIALSYVNIFFLAAFGTALVIPFVFFLKGNKPGADGAGEAGG